MLSLLLLELLHQAIIEYTNSVGLYNTDADTLVAADASSIGLGAILTQKQQNNQWLPIAYASRALTPSVRRYAQIDIRSYACEISRVLD